MEFNQLRGFIAVAREQNFTRAAETLFLTQPALSHQIKSLEEELDEILFERHSRQVRLTEAGRLLLARAEQILGLVAQTQQELAALKGLQTGRLRIGTSDTTCLYILPAIVQTFRNDHPGIDIHLTNRPSSEVLALLKEGAIDFGIVTLPVVDAQVETHPLFPRRDVAVCSPTHPLATHEAITLAELVQYPLLLLEKGSTSRELLDQAFAEVGNDPNVMDLGSIEVIKRYVEIGLGISVVPEIAVAAEVEAGRLCSIQLPWLPERAVGLVQRRNGYLSPAAAVFLERLGTATEPVSAAFLAG